MTVERELISNITDDINLDLEYLQENPYEESENFLKNSIAKLEKIEALLKLKENEEKKVRLSRVQVEEESRNILSKLQNAEVSDAISNNCKAFINLINKQNKITFDSNKEDAKDNETNQEETEKTKSVKIHHPFIERNIQLAKCGRGTLSMTEEEHLRIKNLVGPENEETQPEPPPKEETTYGFEEEFQSKLAQIDEQLALLIKSRSGARDPEEHPPEEVKNEENFKNKLSRKNRLKEIDSILGAMSSASLEEIKPLPDPDIKNLLQQATCSGSSEETGVECKDLLSDPNNSGQLSHFKPLNEIISDLVQDAKSLMPKFKYRYEC